MAPCLWVLVQLLSVGFHKMLAIVSQFCACVLRLITHSTRGAAGGFVFKLFTCTPKLLPPSVICLFRLQIACPNLCAKSVSEAHVQFYCCLHQFILSLRCGFYE